MKKILKIFSILHILIQIKIIYEFFRRLYNSFGWESVFISRSKDGGMQLKWRERSLLYCQFVEKKGNKEKKSPNELLLREREKKLNSKFRFKY